MYVVAVVTCMLSSSRLTNHLAWHNLILLVGGWFPKSFRYRNLRAIILVIAFMFSNTVMVFVMSHYFKTSLWCCVRISSRWPFAKWVTNFGEKTKTLPDAGSSFSRSRYAPEQLRRYQNCASAMPPYSTSNSHVTTSELSPLTSHFLALGAELGGRCAILLHGTATRCAVPCMALEETTIIHKVQPNQANPPYWKVSQCTILSMHKIFCAQRLPVQCCQTPL